MMDEDNDSSFTPHVLTEQEIMHKYWKISMNVRLASVALQRWMSSIIGLITTWSAIRMVFWLSHTPNWYGVFMFIIPLLLLPLLATSYAEVNYEGEKVIQVGGLGGLGLATIFHFSPSCRPRREFTCSSISTDIPSR